MNPYFILVPVAICTLVREIRNIRKDYLELKGVEDTQEPVAGKSKKRPEINSLPHLISALKEITPLHLFMR